MNLFKALATISIMTIFSRILGFIRDMLIARYFGAGMTTDAFFVAFKLPNLLRRIFAEGAFSQAFVPILAEYKKQHSKKDIHNFISYVSGMLILILTIIIILGILTSPWVVYITAPGFLNYTDKFKLTCSMLRITFPYILLISLSALVSAILTTWNYFSVPSLTPAFLNISIIFFTLFFTSYFNPPIIALAWAVTLGGVLQLVYQLPSLKKIDMLVLPRFNISNAGVCRVIRVMGPAIIGVSISQISLMINTIFASFLVSGSVSWIYYADRLMEFPSGVLGVSLGTILLSSLSKTISVGYFKESSYLIDWGLRLCFILALPSSIALGLLSKPLITVLFQYRQFTSFDTKMTQNALIAYAIGLMGLILVKVLAPAFYSYQNIKTPVKIAILTLILTQFMNLVFICPFKHAGLALSIGLAAYFNAILLYWQLRKQKMYIPQPGWSIFIIKIVVAVMIMTVAITGLMWLMPEWDSGVILIRVLRLIGIILAGASSYLGTLAFLGFRINSFTHKFFDI
ncbi:murein biosynthesis integral membrane protein MurJ [Candidatus Profftia sp. (ex Adelges kitamiensis)]|uniref:murein biosynthesis integral membrane protein MurJ n=1 Tax=Candidatus Profftia sp. (ex Adelges kitamiensis) TaxID=2864218 RepID=UPI001CE2399B|nr:murein biosynthesis integral membrane protein MurJ [Candidatus Profftia sp. (ex Adelges kitamiensis)]